jgi:hypothetical protein
MSDALRLPPRPDLEQYRKLAKDFQSACKSGEPSRSSQDGFTMAEKALPAERP